MSTLPIPVFFIGCVKSSEVALKALQSRPEIVIMGVLTLKVSKFNTDFVDIAKIAVQSEIPVYYAEETGGQELATILRDDGVEIIFTIGWSRLLKKEILDIPRYGVVGFHPAALPKNRGRHPLIWALALGLEQTASTLFVMDQGADSGPILSQEPVVITLKDDARSLYNKVLALLPGQINSIIDNLLIGDGLYAVKQNHILANNWRKRGTSDGLIDWRMSAEAIYNLTRALTDPYIGAQFRCRNQLVILWRCKIVTEGVPLNAEPGKVLMIDEYGPTVKAGLGVNGGAVQLLKTENCPKLYKGEYL
jgi:methionyl-tRNA formyltransferase